MEEQKPTNLRDVAELFPPEMRDSPYILIAGGAAVDLGTNRDVDIFFFGPDAMKLWGGWQDHLECMKGVHVYQIYPPGDYDPPAKDDGDFDTMLTERCCVEIDGWGDELDIIIRQGYHRTAVSLLNSFDICQAQIGYRLNGECVTGDEFEPDGLIKLSKAGKRTIDIAPNKFKAVSKSRLRLEKYKRKLGCDIQYISWQYGTR